jgi:hypothetical protein
VDEKTPTESEARQTSSPSERSIAETCPLQPMSRYIYRSLCFSVHRAETMLNVDLLWKLPKVYSPRYAMASLNPGPRSRDYTYLRWSSRLDSPPRALDGEWTGSSLITNTSPRWTRASNVSIGLAHQDVERWTFWAPFPPNAEVRPPEQTCCAGPEAAHVSPRHGQRS